MIYVGINIAKDKHDCYIVTSDGVLISDKLRITNTLEGFNTLYSIISSNCQVASDVRIGLESTGHYGINLENFLRTKGYQLTVFNPLAVASFRKSQTLRKTKTDKVDAKFITTLLFNSDQTLTALVSDEIRELKSLTRHRYRLIGQCAKLKVSISRLLTILFPELETLIWSIHQKSSYDMLLEFPSAHDISNCYLTKLTNLLSKTSKGKYGKDKTIALKNLASKSIGINSSGTSFELQQTIRIINYYLDEISILDKKIKELLIQMKTPLVSIPRISYTLASIILSEVGEITRFQNPAKLLVFAGLEPSVYKLATGYFNGKKRF
ncbi:MAG: IS110 family transposase [Cetobacterium sp.]|uniref:IS110 family transposase n=1 Tax=Cetobacterium sp. TaxID=2071632 RepID=UPI003F40D78E